MKDYRFYLLLILWMLLNLFGIYLLFSLDWMFSIIFLIVIQIQFIYSIILYFKSIWWPRNTWIDKSLVEIIKIEVPSNNPNEKLKGLIIRDKKRNPNEKQIGILFHHGYRGNKETTSHFLIPLALNGCTILSIDARGHGESISKNFNRDDIIGILSDVKNEIDFLEKIDGVDPNKLVMIGHSMGATATLTRGYQDSRLKKIIAISAPFNHLESFNKNKTFTTKIIKKKTTRLYKEDLDQWNKSISAEYFLENKSENKERVYLVHSKNDDLIPFENALKIKKALNLPEENVLFLEKPDFKYWMSAHLLVGQETILTHFLIKIINNLKN